ncbi:MAG: hypothetical protein CMJ18_17245 [Phycisphaeraceae bacterium]|nr:hypothetical protein [Phycisphaeraceae bacterium]
MPTWLPALLVLVMTGASTASRAPTLDELLLDAQPPGSTDGADGADQRKAAPEDDEGDPFKKVVSMMGEASSRLSDEHDASIATQRIQKSILDRLDQMIADAESRRGNPSGSQSKQSKQRRDQGSGKQSQQPSASRSAATQPGQGKPSPGGARKADLSRPMRQLRREWGHLPDRVRDELIQGLEERFSPVYRTLTESYFRRLAEEDD